MNDKLKMKLRYALRDEIISIEQLTNILTFKTNVNLTKFMNAINEMYSDDEIMPVTINDEKCLMLRRK